MDTPKSPEIEGPSTSDMAKTPDQHAESSDQAVKTVVQPATPVPDTASQHIDKPEETESKQQDNNSSSAIKILEDVTPVTSPNPNTGLEGPSSSSGTILCIAIFSYSFYYKHAF